MSTCLARRSAAGACVVVGSGRGRSRPRVGFAGWVCAQAVEWVHVVRFSHRRRPHLALLEEVRDERGDARASSCLAPRTDEDDDAARLHLQRHGTEAAWQRLCREGGVHSCPDGERDVSVQDRRLQHVRVAPAAVRVGRRTWRPCRRRRQHRQSRPFALGDGSRLKKAKARHAATNHGGGWGGGRKRTRRGAELPFVCVRRHMPPAASSSAARRANEFCAKIR